MNCKKRFYGLLNSEVFVLSLLRGARYRTFLTLEEVKSFQVERFNLVWSDAFTNVPFYRDWKVRHNLPDNIRSLDELTDWPILTKGDLQSNENNLLRVGVKPSGYLMTGGSTGEPLHLPTWKDKETSPSMWLGRANYGVQPGDKTFLLWGHHHLYGKGFIRQINIFKRNIKDWLSNIKRVSAYDLSEKAMRDAFNKYKKFKPDFIIGFSSSILSFVRINRNLNKAQSIFPKAVLCTAGPLHLNEINEIQQYFNAPVCMEYGSAECGVMAYTEPKSKEYLAFWDTHLLQGIKDNLGEVKNIVTRLTSCYTPLIKYDIGDNLELDNGTDLTSIIKITKVKGRTSDMVMLKDGTTFFGALIGDSVKQVQSVVANQLHVFQDCMRIDLVASRNLLESDYSLIRLRLITVVPGLKNHKILIYQVDQLYKTIGGKTPLVIRHESNFLN